MHAGLGSGSSSSRRLQACIYRHCGVAIIEQVLWYQRRLEALAELGELGAQAQEELELDRLFNCGHQSQLLQIQLQIARSILGLCARAACRQLLVELLGSLVLTGPR